MAIKLIVGLGNPGAEYLSTRHNIGAWLTEMIAKQEGQQLRLDARFQGLTASVPVNGRTCRLINPVTYMNRSGQAVQTIARFYQILPEEILVAHDELDLAPGVARLKFDGGHGGHNGLRNIIAHLNTSQFHRLRIGIGHPTDRNQVSNYVLNRPSGDEKNRIEDALATSLNIIPLLLADEIAKATQQLNT